MTGNKMLAPSLLSADFGNLARDIDIINSSRADWLHIDIMDGVFVPNISFGFPVLEYVKKLSQKPLDVHLMIVEPNKFIQECKNIGAMMMNVHYEACTHLHRTITAIRQAGMKAGVTLNPHTPVELLEDIVNEVDLVLIMSVNPGFGGQKFIENTVGKIHALYHTIADNELDIDIEVDGGINAETAESVRSAGANVLVAGSYIYGSSDIAAAIASLRG